MKLTFEVPDAAQRSARRALDLHRDSPLPDVGGLAVAEVLTSGVATLDVVGKVHRFFRVNGRVYAAESQALHTEHDSPLVRSWLLYGAESARRWAEGLYRQAVREGYRPSDAVTDLFISDPEQIYAAFSIGAWRFEYDLDPRKAARFVEEYHRATGWNLDLHRAFGESAPAVATALHRRFHPIDPFREAARCLTVEDVEYRLAAQVDLAELTHSLDALEEGLKPSVFTASAAVTARMVWPAFVAYVILAVERPDLIVAMNKGSAKPPLLGQKPKTYLQYHDALNTFVTFFHPQGARYIDPGVIPDSQTAKAFGTLSQEMEDLMVRAYYGRTILPAHAQKLLGKARRWTAENKFAGSLFHVFNADWKKGNWQHILDNIPEDADVRPYFTEFVKDNPMPAAGVKLQQTLSDKKLKQEVAEFLHQIGQIEDGTADFLDAVKISDTQTGEAFEKIGTPLGVYSLVDHAANKFHVLGAFKTKGGVHYVLRHNSSTGKLVARHDPNLAQSVSSGQTKVLLAHKDMPGSAYSGKKPVSPKPVGQHDDPNVAVQTDPQIKTPSLHSKKPDAPQGEPAIKTGDSSNAPESGVASLAKAYHVQVSSWNPVLLSLTAWASAVYTLFDGLMLATGQQWQFDDGNDIPLRLLGAWGHSAFGIHIVFRRTVGNDIVWLVDAEEAVFQSKKGKLIPLGWTPKTEPVKQDLAPQDNPNAADEPDPFAFGVGDIITIGDARFLIVGDKAVLDSAGAYVTQRLGFDDNGNPHTPTYLPGKAMAAKYAALFATVGDPPTALAKAFTYPPKVKALADTTHGSVSLGDKVQFEDLEWYVIGFVEIDDIVRMFLARKDSAFWAFSTDASVAELAPESSYDPPTLVPEVPHEVDEPDPEQGNPEMSGTAEALAYIKNKGWTPAVASENALFIFPLGSNQFYGTGKTRLIVGYAFNEKGTPVYVHVTEKANLGWVESLNAHSKYGPLDAMVQYVVDALQPKPGEKKQIFPKLNYKLSALAKSVALENDLIYVPSPKGALFHVGTPLLVPQGAGKVVLLGWVEAPPDGAYNLPYAVLRYEASTDVGDFYTENLPTLNSSYTLQYDGETAFDKATGEITFGKKVGDDNLTVNMPTAFLPSDPAAGWDDPAPVQQPPIPVADKGKHVSAGIIAIVPGGSTMVSAGSGGVHALPSPAVVLYRPMGRFGGYKLCIPKGTIDKGQSILQTAVREFHEETGLTARPVAYLGDFRGNQSITRLFVGYVTGGSPYKKKQPEEADFVTFKSLAFGEYKDKKWYEQLVPQSGNKWQQHAINAAVEWLDKNGLPENFQAPTETEDSAVTLPDDVPDPFAGVSAKVAAAQELAKATGQPVIFAAQQPKPTVGVKSVVNPPGWKPNIPPKNLDEGDPWKALLFKVDFPITSTMVDVLKNKAQAIQSVPVSFDCSRTRTHGPKYGEAFQTAAGTPYLAAGYVSWADKNQVVTSFLLVQTAAGSVDAVPCALDGLKGVKASSDQSLATGSQDAWYQHPNAVTNAVIQKVYQTGTLDGLGVSMKTFKESWMKAAGLPAYAVVTANILRDVASLFVPGACPQVTRDAILLCLKSRMKATHSGKKATGAPTTTHVSTAKPPPGPIEIPLPPKIVLQTGPLSPILKQYVNTPQPHLFGQTGKSVKGGSKPNMLLNGPGGKQWLAKYAPGEDFRSYIDRAAYQLSELCKPNNVPVGVMEFDGKLVSYQPFAPNALPPPDPTDLDEQNMAELLAQHAVDMFMGDHDGHAGNWISVDGRIIAIDRGQAFKFLLQNKPESLDPSWHAPGNFGDGYAKRLLLQWGKGEVEIPEMAWVSMLKAIRSIEAIKTPQLLAILDPVFDSLGTKLEERQRVVSALLKRQKSYEKDWTAVLRKQRSKFQWPKIGAVSAPTKVFTSDPKDVGFGKREEKIIADAVAAKWQGKAVQLGGLAFEGQEVMVRRVLWEEKPGLKIPSTLLHFRIARPAGLQAAKKLYSSSNLEIAETLGGPQRLKADHQGGFWEKIYAAIKTINHHLFKQKDLEVNLNTVGQMNALLPTLQGLIQKAVDPSGVYAPTNEPNEAVYAMAEQYLQYLQIVNYWVDHKAELIGQHSPTLVEFLWEPPVPEHAIAKDAPPYKVSLKKQGALWPTAVPVGQEVHVTNLNKPVMNSGNQSQFVIEDPLTKARIFWNPPGGLTGQGLENVKDGVESLKGHGWAIIPGDPSSATVAHLLKLFAAATGLPVQTASEQDAEVLYWSKQAATLQGGGVVKPKPDHTAIVDPAYKAALEAYDKGDAQTALTRLQAFVAEKLGKPVSDVQKLPSKADIAGRYTRGAGFLRHERIGWDRKRLVEVMGKDCRVAHRLSDEPVSWMQAMANNGALLSNAIKAYYGVTKTGASPGQDMTVGGGQGLFACFRKGFSNKSGMIYFDISLALRLDLYIVGTGDTYGNTGKERYTTPEQWVKMGAHLQTGPTDASSDQQVSVRHDIDLQQYLVAVMCGSQSARAECIKIANSLGWTFYGGAAPDTVFRA